MLKFCGWTRKCTSRGPNTDPVVIEITIILLTLVVDAPSILLLAPSHSTFNPHYTCSLLYYCYTCCKVILLYTTCYTVIKFLVVPLMTLNCQLFDHTNIVKKTLNASIKIFTPPWIYGVDMLFCTLQYRNASKIYLLKCINLKQSYARN